MEELRTALELIKETCEKNTNCKTCPVPQIIGDCVADAFNIPEEWEMEGEE